MAPRTPCIAPSILSADFARLGQEVEAVLAAGAAMIHVDVMDNHYVPNLTIGPAVCAALRPLAKVPLDVHLMCKPVDGLIPAFAAAGADIISAHPEASEHVHRTLTLIREQGCRAGLALNPATPVHVLDHVMDRLDLILVMSVNPGFGGQRFIPATLDKLRAIRRLINEHEARRGAAIALEIDGGIKLDNIRVVAEAGCDTFVIGSAIFGAPDAGGGYGAIINAFKRELTTAASRKAA
jgi:ribulose-phosphate 3-epimerase